MMSDMRTLLRTAATAIVLAACNGATAPVTDEYEGLPADQVLFGVEHETTAAGIRRATLRADTTLMYQDSALVDLRGVHLDLYDENGRLNATLTSRSGEMNRTTNRMVARGDVVLEVRGPQARTIWTEELHYDPGEKRIWSDVRTRSRTEAGEEVTGEGFTADDAFENFTIERMTGSGLRIEF